jgi:hypothetical protein
MDAPFVKGKTLGDEMCPLRAAFPTARGDAGTQTFLAGTGIGGSPICTAKSETCSSRVSGEKDNTKVPLSQTLFLRVPGAGSSDCPNRSRFQYDASGRSPGSLISTKIENPQKGLRLGGFIQ